MRRQTKKLALTMLLSVAMISANLQLVSAQEESVTETNEASDDHSSDGAASSQDAGEARDDSETNQEGNTSQTEDSTPSEPSTPTEPAAPVEPSTPAEPSTPTEPSAPAEPSTPADTETGKTDGADTQAPVTDTDKESGEGTGTEQEGSGEQDSQNPDASTGEDGAASDDTAAAESGQPEQTFVNKDGEEVKPSELIGVDYSTIAGSYDGETNAVKQYVVSDEVPAGTIINSYVDENGNLMMVISQGAAGTVLEEEKEEEEKTVLEELAETFRLDSELGSSSSAPPVDGSFSGWDDVPSSYEFNWNKPDAWVDGEHYTDPNTTDVRHEMKLYSDGENVYLRIVYARELKDGQIANGDDFQFWIDNQQMAAYQVQWTNGDQLSYNSGEPGVYMVEVRHRDSGISYALVDGAVAYYRINENNLNNELELKIPMSEFVKQNPNINLDNYSMIGFFTPNLMQDKIYTAGASTGAEPFAAAAFLLVPTSCILIKKKNEKEGFGIA